MMISAKRAGNQATSLLAAQKKYTPGQIAMAKAGRHLVWVNRPNRTLAPGLRKRIWREHGPNCAYCECVLNEQSFTVDHKLAVANGGTDAEENLTVACRPCNSKKGARL